MVTINHGCFTLYGAILEPYFWITISTAIFMTVQFLIIDIFVPSLQPCLKAMDKAGCHILHRCVKRTTRGKSVKKGSAVADSSDNFQMTMMTIGEDGTIISQKTGSIDANGNFLEAPPPTTTTTAITTSPTNLQAVLPGTEAVVVAAAAASAMEEGSASTGRGGEGGGEEEAKKVRSKRKLIRRSQVVAVTPTPTERDVEAPVAVEAEVALASSVVQETKSGGGGEEGKEAVEKGAEEGEEEEEEEEEEEIDEPKHKSSLFLMFQCFTAAATAIVALNSFDRGETAWESYTNLQGLIANSCVTTTLASSFLGLAELVTDQQAGRKYVLEDVEYFATWSGLAVVLSLFILTPVIVTHIIPGLVVFCWLWSVVLVGVTCGAGALFAFLYWCLWKPLQQFHHLLKCCCCCCSSSSTTAAGKGKKQQQRAQYTKETPLGRFIFKLALEFAFRCFFIFTFQTLTNYMTLFYTQKPGQISPQDYLYTIIGEFDLRSQTECFLAKRMDNAKNGLLFLTWL